MSTTIKALTQRARSLIESGDYKSASDILEPLRSDPKKGLFARRKYVDCLMFLHRWEEAATAAQDLMIQEAPIKADVRRWATVCAVLDKPDACSEATRHFTQTQQQEGTFNQAGPTVVIVAPPKTGSTTMSVAIAAALNAPKIEYMFTPATGARWNLPIWPALDTVKGRAMVCHTHAFAEPAMLQALEARDWIKVVVHLRDPVEALESCADMVLRIGAPALLSLQAQVDPSSPDAVRSWLLEDYLPRVVEWMTSWVALHDAGHPSIAALTTLDEVRSAGQDQVARRVVETGMGCVFTDAVTTPQRYKLRLDGADKFMLGDTEKDRIRAAFPRAFLERFGWS